MLTDVGNDNVESLGKEKGMKKNRKHEKETRDI